MEGRNENEDCGREEMPCHACIYLLIEFCLGNGWPQKKKNKVPFLFVHSSALTHPFFVLFLCSVALSHTLSKSSLRLCVLHLCRERKGEWSMHPRHLFTLFFFYA